MVDKASDLQSVKLDPKLLGEYAGAYQYRDPAHPDAAHVYDFAVSDGQLSMSQGSSSFRLITLSATSFATENGLRFDFFRDTRGAVAYVVALTSDGDIKATREK